MAEFMKPMSTKEITLKQQKITDVVSDLLKKTAAIDSAFKFTDVILSGSVSEGLKVREPDEFDFLLVLDTEFEIQEMEDDPPGFVSIKSPPKGKRMESFLDPLLLRKQFFRALTKAIQEFYPGNMNVHMSGTGVSVNIQVWDVGGLSGIVHDVDLVLALKGPGKFWPKCAMEWKTKPHGTGLSSAIVEQVLNSGVHFVARQEHQTRSTEDERKTLSRWRLSFSIAEEILLKSLNETQRHCYRILKVILAKGPERDDVNKWITSYHIKTLLLHVNETTTDRATETREYIIHLLEQLIHCITVAELKHYFVPEINLFAKMKDVRCCTILGDSYKEDHESLVQYFEETKQTLPQDLTELKGEAKQGLLVTVLPSKPYHLDV